MGPEVWLITWYCTGTAPACTFINDKSNKLTIFKSEMECVSYATNIANTFHTGFNIDLEYACRKGAAPEPYIPNRRP